MCVYIYIYIYIYIYEILNTLHHKRNPYIYMRERKQNIRILLGS